MNEADDNVVEVRDLDQLFEEVLAGEVRNPDAPGVVRRPGAPRLRCPGRGGARRAGRARTTS